jgi:hypothetical protein
MWVILAGTLAWARNPVGPGVFFEPTSEREFLKASPRMRLQADSQLQKNVNFWVRIYSEFSSNQGLIHDAKYIDHVYEVLVFTGSTRENARLIKKQKQKWKDLLLSVHRKQNEPDKMNEEERRVF